MGFRGGQVLNKYIDDKMRACCSIGRCQCHFSDGKRCKWIWSKMVYNKVNVQVLLCARRYRLGHNTTNDPCELPMASQFKMYLFFRSCITTNKNFPGSEQNINVSKIENVWLSTCAGAAQWDYSFKAYSGETNKFFKNWWKAQAKVEHQLAIVSSLNKSCLSPTCVGSDA